MKQLDTYRQPYKKYFADVVVRVYEKNRQNCEAPTLFMASINFILYAEKMILKEGWSPDVVVGEEKKSKNFDTVPCTKTLYYWTDKVYLKVKNSVLLLKTSRKNKSSKSREHKRNLGTSIEARPESVETRQEFGHWEIDTVLGHKSKVQALLTLVE